MKRQVSPTEAIAPLIGVLGVVRASRMRATQAERSHPGRRGPMVGKEANEGDREKNE